MRFPDAHAARPRSRLAGFAMLLMLPLAGACDPCSGVVGCRPGARVAYEGRLVDPFDGLPAAGVPVEFRREGGVALDADTLRGVSAADGRFLLTGDAAEPGTVSGTLQVGGPGQGSEYAIDSLDLATVSLHGDGRFLQDLPAYPFVDVGLPVVRRAGGTSLPQARVEFRPTGGVAVTPAPYQASSDDYGNVAILLRAAESGWVEGDLLVTPRNSTVPLLAHGVRFQTRTTVGRTWLIPQRVGPWLGYFARVVWSDGTPAAGVEILLRRTGGVTTMTEGRLLTSNADGYFSLELIPNSAGVLLGEVFARVPGGTRQKIGDVEMPTFETDEYRLLTTWVLAQP